MCSTQKEIKLLSKQSAVAYAYRLAHKVSTQRFVYFINRASLISATKLSEKLSDV